MIDQTLISLISAGTALIASLAGPFVTLRVGRQQFKANVLSVNRQRWIETMRDALAGLIAQLQTAATVRQNNALLNRATLASDFQLLTRVEELARTIAKIDLLLNPFEEDHQRLRELMDKALDWLRADAVGPTLVDDMDAVANDVVRVAQGILKREWIRVKRGD